MPTPEVPHELFTPLEGRWSDGWSQETQVWVTLCSVSSLASGFLGAAEPAQKH